MPAVQKAGAAAGKRQLRGKAGQSLAAVTFFRYSILLFRRNAMKAADAVKKSRGFWGEFREFITKGNVMDMAVGVIIGAAFKAIVDSLVNDILMPVIGIFVKTDSLTSVAVTVGSANITIGNFIAAIINFLILALVLFLMVKLMNRAREAAEKMAHIRKEETKEEAPAPSKEEVLLTEIRDLLKAQQK